MTSDSASRVTRSSRSLRLALLAFAGVLAVATVLRAQESPPAAAPPVAGPAPAAQEEAPAEAAPASDAATDGQRAAADAAAPARPAPGSSPTRFEPTEKVRADFDVSFPIDI